MTPQPPGPAAPARPSARKCAEIPDALFLQAVLETEPSNPRPRLDPAPEWPAALVVALAIQSAVTAGGWHRRTPTRAPFAVYRTLLKSVDVPVKVFYAKARILDERRGLLNTYDGRWHLASECLDVACCETNAAALAPPEPVTTQEFAFMREVLARERDEIERRALWACLPPYEIDDPVLLAMTEPPWVPLTDRLVGPPRPAQDAQAAIKGLIGKVLGAPGATPGIEETRRRILGTVGIRVDPDGWVADERQAEASRAGCRFAYGTWIHRAPHTCPAYVRGPAARRGR